MARAVVMPLEEGISAAWTRGSLGSMRGLVTALARRSAVESR
jgi:hypothetical protein